MRTEARSIDGGRLIAANTRQVRLSCSYQIRSFDQVCPAPRQASDRAHSIVADFQLVLLRQHDGGDALGDIWVALARAIGLGSARERVGSWWAERVSAVALIPLTLWFAASIIVHTGSDYTTFVAWLRAPLVATLMILLLTALFHHTALGLQVVIEDYIHSGAKFAAVIAVRLGCFALAVAGFVATLRIAFSGAHPSAIY